MSANKIIKIRVTNLESDKKIFKCPNKQSITHVVSLGRDAILTQRVEQMEHQIPEGFNEYAVKKLRTNFISSAAVRSGMILKFREDIRKLIEFFREALETKDSSFLIHCTHGKGRSATAAKILLYMYYRDEEKVEKELRKIVTDARIYEKMMKEAMKILKEEQSNKK